MGTRAELVGADPDAGQHGIRPVIDWTRPLADAAEGFAAMISGEAFGKIVFEL